MKIHFGIKQFDNDAEQPTQPIPLLKHIKSINQSINQLISWSLGQLVTKSISQWVSQSKKGLIAKKIPFIRLSMG